MPYIKLADVKSYTAFLEASAQGLGATLPDAQNKWEDRICTLLKNHKQNWKVTPYVCPALYFDNFEDIINSSDQERSKIYTLLLRFKNLGYHLLFSSQCSPKHSALSTLD